MSRIFILCRITYEKHTRIEKNIFVKLFLPGFEMEIDHMQHLPHKQPSKTLQFHHHPKIKYEK